VLAEGVEETAPESLDDESSLDVEEDAPAEESLDDVSSLDVAEDAPDVSSLAADDVSDAVVVALLTVAVLCSDGSCPSCSRSASTPKTATKDAIAPAAKRRRLGARRRRLRIGSSGMRRASTRALKTP
jgi:hypothetical protein